MLARFQYASESCKHDIQANLGWTGMSMRSMDSQQLLQRLWLALTAELKQRHMSR